MPELYSQYAFQNIGIEQMKAHCDMVEDFVQLSDFVSQLRSFGCKIAIDDFGAGYSNMENILKLSPDCIKIDGSLIHNIDQSEESLKLVENIINIAHDINVKTVAEHVHSQTVYRTLNAMEIDYLQGYYLAKPFPLAELSVNSISVPEK
ncbi:MAG: EAL domain-containing protein [Sulfurovum sp.]|nr:EAL domain-containing protein [Sulfurovum sp.]